MSDNPDQKPASKCDPALVAILHRCSERNDLSEWNTWRENNITDNEEIPLQGAKLLRLNLDGIDLSRAHLEKASLAETRLSNANLAVAHFEDTNLVRTDFMKANLTGAGLERTTLMNVTLEEADLRYAKLQNASVWKTNLKGAHLEFAQLEGVCFNASQLEGASFRYANVKNLRFVFNCTVDRQTDFRDVNLGASCIDQALQQLLKDNGRRLNWLDWYKTGPRLVQLLKWALVHPIWWISDYGRSTLRIIGVFAAFVLLFATVYFCCGLTGNDLLDNLFVKDQGGNVLSNAAVFVRACYFSIVAMTTVGFGDVCVNPQSIWGHVLVSLQVILGYVMLGAVVTRLGILFTANGPSASVSRTDKRAVRESPQK